MSNKTDIRRIREQMNIGKNKTIVRIGAEYELDTMSEEQLQQEYRFFSDPVVLVGSEYEGY